MQSYTYTLQRTAQHVAALPVRSVGPAIYHGGLHIHRCKPAVIVQAAAAEADRSSDQPRKTRRPKSLKQDDWAQLKQAIHEDGTVLQPSSSSDGLDMQQVVSKLVEDADLRKTLPKVLDDKAARRYPPVRLLATTPAAQVQCMSALAAASKKVAMTLNPRPPPAAAAAAAADGSTAEEASSSSSSSSSGGEKPRAARFSTARVAWQPVPVNSQLSDVVDVPAGSIVYYTTPALLPPPLWRWVSRKQDMPFEVRPNRNPAVQMQRISKLQQQILDHLDESGQECVLVRCRGVEGLVLLNRILAWLRRSLQGADWWEGGDMAAVMLYDYPRLQRDNKSSSSSNGGSSSAHESSSSGDDGGKADAEQQQQQAVQTVYVVALCRCTPKQPWALDVLVPDSPQYAQRTQQQAAEQQ